MTDAFFISFTDDLVYVARESFLPANWPQIVNSHGSINSLEKKTLPTLPSSSVANDFAGSLHIWELPSDSSLMHGRDIILGNRRNIFLRGRKGFVSPYLLPVINFVVGDSALRRTKISGHDVDHDVDKLTRVHTSSAYDLVFSVVNPDPEKLRINWDVQQALEGQFLKHLSYLFFHLNIALFVGYLKPFLNSIADVSKFSVESQQLYELSVLHQSDYRSRGGISWLQSEKCFVLPESLLSQIITRLEAKLGKLSWRNKYLNFVQSYRTFSGSYSSSKPALHFVIYVNPYSEQQGPLRIARLGSKGYVFSPTNAFISPRWGGLLVVNQLINKTSLPAEALLSSKDVMGVFLSQLRRLLGFPSTKVRKLFYMKVIGNFMKRGL